MEPSTVAVVDKATNKMNSESSHPCRNEEDRNTAPETWRRIQEGSLSEALARLDLSAKERGKGVPC